MKQKETIRITKKFTTNVLHFAKAKSIFKEILSYSKTRFYSGIRKRLAAKNVTNTTGLL